MAVEIFFEPRIIRGAKIARALAQGARAAGISFIATRAEEYRGKFRAENAAFYGLHGNLRTVYDAALRDVNFLFVDLGYWKLGSYVDGSLNQSYHRVGLNDRHPNAYFRQRKHPNTRFLRLGLKPNFTRTKRGDAVFVIGMGRKVAAFHGIEPGSWERGMVEQIREYTDRPIVYRPKLNNVNDARTRPPEIPGTTYSMVPRIQDDLESAHCVVVHQSNVAIDAMLAGVPAIVTSGGAAAAICPSNISLVDDPPMPDEETRQQFFNDLAYAQWTLDEMQDGTFWRHAVEEDLLQ